MKGVTSFEKLVVDGLKGKQTSQIRFRYGGRSITPETFQKVAAAILKNRIQVRKVGEKSNFLNSGADGTYDASLNTFYIRTSSSDALEFWPLVVHEAVHARSDMKSLTVDAFDEEITAYIAGCAAKVLCGHTTDDDYFRIGKLGLGEKPNADSKASLQRLRDAVANLKSDGHLMYPKGKKYVFDGVPAAKKGKS